jgi:vitamin B12 transport system ATP-binding protein
LLNVSALLHRTVHQLSGGEWQRVRLAAMCLQVWPTLNPYSRLLILDEPSAPLDIGQERYLQQMITQLAKHGLTVVVANHNLNVTLKQADQVILLNKGVAIASGTPTAVLLPDVLSTVYDAEVEIAQVNGKPMLLFNGTL